MSRIRAQILISMLPASIKGFQHYAKTGNRFDRSSNENTSILKTLSKTNDTNSIFSFHIIDSTISVGCKHLPE